MPLPPDIGLAATAWFDQPLAAVWRTSLPSPVLPRSTAYYNHSLLTAANRRAAVQSGLRLTVHGPWEGADVGHPSEAARKAALAVHRRHLEAAVEVGAAPYCAHPDYSLAPIARSSAVRAALQRSVVELAALQDEYGVEVTLENLMGADHSHFARPGDLDLGELGLALDTGHAAACGALAEFLREPQAQLRHVHLHDNAGPVHGETGETAPGPGPRRGGRRRVWRRLRRAGASTTIEVLTPEGVHASLDYLRRAWCRLDEADGWLPDRSERRRATTGFFRRWNVLRVRNFRNLFWGRPSRPSATVSPRSPSPSRSCGCRARRRTWASCWPPRLRRWRR